MNEQKSGGKKMIKGSKRIGEVQVADEVIAMIAGIAAKEVEGVSSVVGFADGRLGSKVGKLGVKYLEKGVKIDAMQGLVSVELGIKVNYGSNIPEVTQKVQERVKSTMESMTGLSVTDVKVKVTGVEVDKNN
ncbi:MAG: Asp23/Gls24 family envelope stress response protein [Lachnospiraceae bacterium]|nr:Asp23/Gls24 family envelope stress response protein [Lachnospiraceae bacterium]